MTVRRRPDSGTVVRNANPRLRLAVPQRSNPYDAIRRQREAARLSTPRAAYRRFVGRLWQAAA